MWEKRVAPLTGVVFIVLLAAGFLLDSNTEFMPSETDVIARLEGGPTRIMIGAYLVLVAAAALLWFSGSIHKALRELDGDTDRLATLAFGGGVFASALLAIGGVATIAAAERVAMNGAIDPGVAAALTDINGVAVGNGAPIGLAVLIGAWGIAHLRGQGNHPWAGWSSALIALGLISPFSWIAIGAAAVWVPVVGVWLYRSATPVPVGVA